MKNTGKKLLSLVFIIILGIGVWFLIPSCVEEVRVFKHVWSMPNPLPHVKWVNSFKRCGCYTNKTTHLDGGFLSGASTRYTIICENGQPYRDSLGYGARSELYVIIPKCEEDPQLNEKNKAKALKIYTNFAKSNYKSVFK